MTMSESTAGLVLNGLDGGNPLGFLAAIGTAVVVRDTFTDVCLGWNSTSGGWRPWLTGCGEDEKEFSRKLFEILRNVRMTVFDINDRMPFDIATFANALQEGQSRSSITDRRDADFLAAIGTELYPDKKEDVFQDSSFRMVRRGDSKGQGLPFYAKAIREKTDLVGIERTLFQPWDYRDEGYSLRWDPMEDQRYALRWRDPSKRSQSDLTDGTGSMIAANSLAIEALRWFPTVLSNGRRAQTTGFHQVSQREHYFVWPIWTLPLGVEPLRSLLSLKDISTDPLPRTFLAKRGIEEVYCSQRIQQNQYYSNFAPARSI